MKIYSYFKHIRRLVICDTRTHSGCVCCIMYGMSKSLIQTFFILFLCAAFLPVQAEGSETIPSFKARITVHDNATIEVSESVVYDFGDRPDRHGIFRIISFSYQAGSAT